jgi:hypothetical protein
MDPVVDPPVRKSGRAENRTRDPECVARNFQNVTIWDMLVVEIFMCDVD